MSLRRTLLAPVAALTAVVVLALVALASPASASARQASLAPRPFPDDATLASFERFIEERMAEEPSAGLSVAFWLDGKVWAKGFGYRDLTKRLPATPTTSYRMASVTKPFTAVAALQLYERGVLDLDADVRRYVPYFPRKSHVITTRQLLGHLSGIPHYKNCKRECFLKTHHDTRQSIAIFAGFPLEAEPGSAYLYTSYGYNLIGAAIEGASGLSYGEYLRRHVFGPAGMSRSGLEDPKAEIEERAVGYRVRSGAVVPSELIDISSRFAGGGTRSTVLDMVAFAAAYLDDKLLHPDTRRMAERSMATSDGVLTDYGMGFGVVPQSGRFVLVHGGGQPETSTLLVLYPAERFAIALAANLEDFHGALHDVKETIVQTVLGDGGARRTPIGDDEVSNVMARVASGLMSHGIAHFTRFGEGATMSPGALADAFERVHELMSDVTIQKDPVAALEAARLGDDPKGGQAYVLAGAHMAAMLARAHGAEHLRRYHDDEPFAFLLDYADVCARTCPTLFRVSPALVARTRTLQRAWQQANNREVRSLRVHPGAKLEEIDGVLAEAFDGARVHPDLSFELLKAADALAARGDEAKARAFVEVALKRHPLSSRALLAAAEQALLDGDRARGAELLARWTRVEEGPVEKRGATIAARAKKLRKKKTSAALDLLALASEHAPSAELYDELASVAEALGQKDRAIAALQAAERLSPSPKRARKLKTLRQ